jgi:hypothetical protein
MPVVMQMHWPEVGLDVYDEAREKVGWEREVPAGAISHVAWMADDGFHAVDVWETAEQFEAFVNDRLMPIVKGELAIPSDPRVTITPAHAAFVPHAWIEEVQTAASTAPS